MGIQWRIRYRLCYELALRYLILKAIILLCLLEFMLWKGWKTVKMCLYNVSARWTVNTDKFTLFVYCNFLVLLSTPVCSQNIHKQNVNKADETLTDYSFLSRYHYTKLKNYLKRRYRIRHWIPMFIGTPCITFSILRHQCGSSYTSSSLLGHPYFNHEREFSYINELRTLFNKNVD